MPTERCLPCQAYVDGSRWRPHKEAGITRSEYLALYAEQGGLCQNCGEPETAGKLLSAHHLRPWGGVDPYSGPVVGLWCDSCNDPAGFLRDDPTLSSIVKEY